MALEVVKLKRIFKFKKDGKDIELTDPNPDLTSAEVMKFYSGSYAELTNAMIQGPIVVNDNAIYSMTTKAGKLG